MGALIEKKKEIYAVRTRTKILTFNVLHIEESYLESVEGEVQLIDLGAVKV